MFKFGFSTENPGRTSDSDLRSLELQWVPSKEVIVLDEKEFHFNAADIGTITVKSEQLQYIKPSIVLNDISNEVETTDENISLAEKSHFDLIPSKYEGGFKIWECTHDVANLLDASQVTGKVVLDLGCGVGLLGILALKLGSKTVHFQDYNADVIQHSTIPNVRLNLGSLPTSSCQFFSGDWSSFSRTSQLKYDLIMTSETIYNPSNYAKLHDCIQSVLKPSGTVLLGAKSYYFGVGGSIRQFEQFVLSKNVFSIESIWKCNEGVQREILLMMLKTTKNCVS